MLMHRLHHRYNEFRTLYDAASRNDLPKAQFPRKVLGGLSEKQLNDRRAGLSSFLSKVLSLPAISSPTQLSLKHFFTRGRTDINPDVRAVFPRVDIPGSILVHGRIWLGRSRRGHLRRGQGRRHRRRQRQ